MCRQHDYLWQAMLLEKNQIKSEKDGGCVAWNAGKGDVLPLITAIKDDSFMKTAKYWVLANY